MGRDILCVKILGDWEVGELVLLGSWDIEYIGFGKDNVIKILII
jgi:hypothetical protein